ncbi:extracellular solute-binding protein [Butyrivibrio sp. AC2005]|uniref:extracellular solute-binding protein n=1 Tax=Butyrivibrio sp. AC2005 TaxID=1280672 RepID=UPI000400F85C|nr:extracellular solute-binding protein [Butyrivibrio sp. AC2005]
MRKKILRSVLSTGLACSVAFSLVACGGAATDTDSQSVSDPDEREKVSIALGRQTTANPKFPEGDNYEDNAYIRMAEEELNIDITDAFEAESGDDYNRQVSLALSAGEIPDMMKVASKDEVKELYENDLIMDLTKYYDEYASDYVKELYDSFEGRALENVTFDGMMMAIPATASDPGTSMCWIRQDWVDGLGLEVDGDGDRCLTVDEVREIAKAFMTANPENAENPVGMAFDISLTSQGSDGTNSINAIAYSVGAYPRHWYTDESGQLIYGSTTEQMKEALSIVRGLFEEGIVDEQLGTRTWDDITSLLTNGQTGVVFGSWHIADWLLNNVYTLNNNAVFTPYAVVNSEGKVNCTHSNSTGEFVVVSKKCKHPELAIMILNLFYDDMVNSDELLEKYPEVNDYLNTGVDGTARPFNIEVKSNTYLLDEYSKLKAALNGTGTKEEIPTVEEKSNYDAITAYNNGTGDVTGWCKIHSRTKGVDLLSYLTDKGLYNWVTPIYPETTNTMETNWANLQTLEEESFIKIVTGAVDIDEGFDTFVKDWKAQGGDTIASEITEQVTNN